MSIFAEKYPLVVLCVTPGNADLSGVWQKFKCLRTDSRELGYEYLVLTIPS